MRRLLILAMLTATLTTVPGLAAAPPARASAVVSADGATSFDAAYPRLTRENFESSPAEPDDYVQCAGPVSSRTGSACFPRGGLRPGVRYLAEPGGTPDALVVFGAGLEFNPTKTIVPGRTDDSLVIDFTSPVDTVGFELGSNTGPTCVVSVSYDDGSPVTDATVPCSDSQDFAFVTVTAERTIDAVRVTSSNGSEFVDNVRFGLRAPNRFTFGTVRHQPVAGTALLPVRVPGVGTLSLMGQQVVARSLDSARPRTLVLTVAAKGHARRTLLRTGRVVVTVRVVFRPNGGNGAAKKRRVTLVRR